MIGGAQAEPGKPIEQLVAQLTDKQRARIVKDSVIA